MDGGGDGVLAHCVNKSYVPEWEKKILNCLNKSSKGKVKENEKAVLKDNSVFFTILQHSIMANTDKD